MPSSLAERIVLPAALLVFLTQGCGEDAPTQGSQVASGNDASTSAGTNSSSAATSSSDSSAGGTTSAGTSTDSGPAASSVGSVGSSDGSSTGGNTSTSGAGGAGSTLSAGGTAGSGGGAAAGCAAADYLICEDFEGTELGGIPDGWTQHGEEASVSDDEVHGGTRSLKLGAIPNWERRIYHDASLLGGAHWGRIYYKVQLPVPDAFVHSTLVALSGVGPTFGESEYRVVDTVKQAADNGSMHQFLYNVQPKDAGEFARGGPYDFVFDGEWHCAEYFIDGPAQSYALYIDGDEEIAFENGPGNYEDSDMPDSFSELRVGWINYQDAPPGFTAWIDDIAFDDTRVGCLP